MLNITKGNTEHLFFTGTENATINNPYFLFVFTHKTTLEEVKILLAKVVGATPTLRYDEVQFDTDDFFLNSTLGFWGYEIYQKSTNTSFTKTGLILEYGFMVLNPASVTLPTEYTDQLNTFKVYNGE